MAVRFVTERTVQCLLNEFAWDLKDLNGNYSSVRLRIDAQVPGDVHDVHKLNTVRKCFHVFETMMNITVLTLKDIERLVFMEMELIESCLLRRNKSTKLPGKNLEYSKRYDSVFDAKVNKQVEAACESIPPLNTLVKCLYLWACDLVVTHDPPEEEEEGDNNNNDDNIKQEENNNGDGCGEEEKQGEKDMGDIFTHN